MKKIFAVILALVLAVSLVACSAAPAQESLKVLKIGASPAPHAQILEFVKPLLKEKGIDLQITEFTDYVVPNTALEAGDLDANYFQHVPYLEEFNANQGTRIISAAAVHFEPLGIYAGKCADLTAIPEGAEIAVPNDPSNEARALHLLERFGILTVDAAVENATAKDVIDNPYNVVIREVEAAQAPHTLEDVAFAVINGNYALQAKIVDKSVKVTDESGNAVYATEDPAGEQASTYANIVAIREGDENREEIKTLVEILTSEAVRDYIVQTFGASVIPVF